MFKELPIYQIRDEIIRTLQNNNKLILHAPTGSGKSTQVPQYLADDVIPKDKKIIVLQPRRIAARMLAGYIARDRNSLLGDEIGYRVRLEGQWSDNTRILFCTEGILLQRLLRNDNLNDTAALIFDEFHERHIETDLCLALARELQKKSRPDLKIVAMSATLETNELQNYLNNCPVIKTEGKAYPVKRFYAQPKPYETLWDFAAAQLESAKELFTHGSALIFMPGAYEIRKTMEAIQKRPSLEHFKVLPLYGSLAKDEQDKAVQPGGRKIIVSTNVAETSLTIPDITLIIDSGIARIARFDPRRGINTLFTEPISKSSANQRAGRAGRTAPGNCIRLWSEFANENRPENDTPEIHRIDLSEVILGLLASGYSSPVTFPWFECPDEQSVQKSLHLLKALGAIDSNNQFTETGKNMAEYAMHPRFSRMLIEAQKNDCLPLACVLAAIAQSTGILIPTNDEIVKNERIHYFGNTSSDLLFELNAWLWAGKKQFKSTECHTLAINPNAARQIAQLAIQLLHSKNHGSSAKKEKLPDSISDKEEIVLRKCIFTGFSDFIAVRHRLNSPTCQMMYGKSGQLHRESVVRDAKLLVATQLEESRTPTGVQLFLKKVTAIEENWLSNLTTNELQKTSETRFDTNLQKVIKTTEWTWNGLVLKRENNDVDNPDETSLILAKAIMDKKITLPLWNEEVEHFIRRVNFTAKHCPQYDIPVIDDEAKEFIIQQTIYGCKGAKDIQRCSVWPALKGWLRYEQLAAVDLAAPETIELPHRHKPVKLKYDEKGDVILSETIQALYDCPLPITVAEGQVSVVFELLAPSRRPVQITRDLDYFWKNSYLEIKKELKGRYPKHEWR
jgi:ATP-dependent helicase HrpB